jgi:hypothetical protein
MPSCVRHGRFVTRGQAKQPLEFKNVDIHDFASANQRSHPLHISDHRSGRQVTGTATKEWNK